jgi:hypothetical protein
MRRTLPLTKRAGPLCAGTLLPLPRERILEYLLVEIGSCRTIA